MYHVEYMVHGPNQYEFVTKGAKPETELPKMQTPRRYTVSMWKPSNALSNLLPTRNINSKTGKCTLVIALLDVFPDGALPNAPKGPLYNTDVATWRDLKFHADNILLQCVVLRHSAGYRVAGMSTLLPIIVLLGCCGRIADVPFTRRPMGKSWGPTPVDRELRKPHHPGGREACAHADFRPSEYLEWE